MGNFAAPRFRLERNNYSEREKLFSAQQAHEYRGEPSTYFLRASSYMEASMFAAL